MTTAFQHRSTGARQRMDREISERYADNEDDSFEAVIKARRGRDARRAEKIARKREKNFFDDREYQ